MGQGSSVPSAESEAFPELYAALPDDVHDMIEALCEKDSVALLKPNLAAPQPFPPSLVGMVIQLDHDVASAALKTVPRLQQKHYQMIPKSLSELDFFLSFFSHLTAIVNTNCPGAFDLKTPPEGSWKGLDGSADTDDPSANSFSVVWAKLSEAKRTQVADLGGKESTTLLAPSATAPAAFPTLPIGMRCFVDEAAATAALSTVPGLQYKHYKLVPSKLDEKSFWTNFFSHVTAIHAAP